MRVAMVVMPFAAHNRPSLAAGLLQSALEERGIECESKYFNLLFSRLLGPENYQTIAASEFPMNVLAGEWAFSQVFYGEAFSDWKSYRAEVLEHEVWGIDPQFHDLVHRVHEAAPMLIELAFESEDWSRFDLVGFTSTFEQTMPSLCLARRIREAHPKVVIAVGGANFEDTMGRPYLEEYPFLDFVSTGEADLSFPALCEKMREVLEGRSRTFVVPPGFLFRDLNGGAEHGEIQGEPASRGPSVKLDDLPIPDYHDFFRVARSNAERAHDAEVVSWMPIEASRGCWWGQKAHCTFCGLNGDTMAFRRKDWRRVANETDELMRRHPGVHLQFADNILSMDYFRDLLPHWSTTAASQVAKFFEIKANLRREQLDMMREAGITSVQPGIESLSDHTLRVMQKGVSAAQNIALMRWCAELGIDAMWNILYGFPGERLEDYDTILDLMQKMAHMPPPLAFCLIRMDRFSPNHSKWREMGFTRVRPMPAYRHIFPFAEDRISEMAYFFEYEHPQLDAAREGGRRIEAWGREWQEHGERGENGVLAVQRDEGGGFELIDRRFNRPSVRRPLGKEEIALLLACDAPASAAKAIERARTRLGDGIDEGELEAARERLLEGAVLAELGGRLVTLAFLPSRGLFGTSDFESTGFEPTRAPERELRPESESSLDAAA